MQLYDTVRYVVEEILMSDKTAQCMAEETRRQNAKASVIVSRWLRQRVASQSSAQRPVNLIEIEARFLQLTRNLPKATRTLAPVPTLIPPSL